MEISRSLIMAMALCWTFRRLRKKTLRICGILMMIGSLWVVLTLPVVVKTYAISYLPGFSGCRLGSTLYVVASMLWRRLHVRLIA
jgi:hypothetical protein